MFYITPNTRSKLKDKQSEESQRLLDEFLSEGGVIQYDKGLSPSDPANKTKYYKPIKEIYSRCSRIVTEKVVTY